MTFDAPVVETFKVTNVSYSDYLSKKDNRTIRVTYYAGIRAFHEYVSIGGSGLPLHRAHNWWKQRHFVDCPNTIEEALARTSELRIPSAIRVHINKTYNGKPSPEILGYEWH